MPRWLPDGLPKQRRTDKSDKLVFVPEKSKPAPDSEVFIDPNSPYPDHPQWAMPECENCYGEGWVWANSGQMACPVCLRGGAGYESELPKFRKGDPARDEWYKAHDKKVHKARKEWAEKHET